MVHYAVVQLEISLMAIKGMTNSTAKVRGELGIKEEDKHSRRLEIPHISLV